MQNWSDLNYADTMKSRKGHSMAILDSAPNVTMSTVQLIDMKCKGNYNAK